MEMNTTVEAFTRYFAGLTREHNHHQGRELTYRSVLKRLLEDLDSSVIAIEEPERQKVGAPDFVIEKEIDHQLRQAKLLASPPLALVEVKDMGKDLDTPENQAQIERYMDYCGNLIHTDYLEFRFYINTKLVTTIKLIERQDDQLIIDSAQYSAFELIYKNLLTSGITVKNAEGLATLMAGRARAIRDTISKSLEIDLDAGKDSELTGQYHAFRHELVSDLTAEKFADLYAQTLTYGLFAARYHDETLENFTLDEASHILPPTNPFLQRFFRTIVSYEGETRINWVLDSLVDVFNRTNVHEILTADPQRIKTHDPIIHFYETFLDKYDPALRRKMGVYYTPLPVVDYIVNQVDKVLKTEFNLADGLADSSNTEVEIKSHPNTKNEVKRGYALVKKQIPRVQVLDPALGTGTFLNEVFNLIAKTEKPKIGSGWSKYVEENLLKRIHGFELMMAPYAMSHLRLNLNLAESGYKPLGISPQRLGVYLTNTLAKPHDSVGSPISLNLFGLQKIIANESRQADEIKANTPVMVIIANPPYSGVSSNETEFANKLITKYKVEPGGQQKLQERKHWLNDDYVKFIAYAEDMIEKTGSGVVAMITNNGYLDNPTFRGMRWHLSKTFDKIFVLDLHGNSKKHETAPSGGKDENVFNIQQGVGIIVAIKNDKPNGQPAEVYHAELFGRRKSKLEALKHEQAFTKLTLDHKYYYFVPRNTYGQTDYEQGIALNKLFKQNVTGIVTMGDNFIIDEDRDVIAHRVKKLTSGGYDEDSLNREFGLGKNYAKYVLANAGEFEFDENKLVQIDYRPFDTRWTYFDNKVLWRWREKVMKNFINCDNLGLAFRRHQPQKFDFQYIFLTNKSISDGLIRSDPGGSESVAPLYIYHDDGSRDANFDPVLLKQLTQNLTINFEPEDVLDYIYAKLYSPAYRTKYKEFLKSDFPRVPTPSNNAEFSRLADLGEKLRELHLMQAPELDNARYLPTGDGNWQVDKISFDTTSDTIGNVYINTNQYFANVSKTAWDYYIGGYQPAQKWLKDRKGRELTLADLVHYQKIIETLTQTAKIADQIDHEA